MTPLPPNEFSVQTYYFADGRDRTPGALTFPRAVFSFSNVFRRNGGNEISFGSWGLNAFLSQNYNFSNPFAGLKIVSATLRFAPTSEDLGPTLSLNPVINVPGPCGPNGVEPFGLGNRVVGGQVVDECFFRASWTATFPGHLNTELIPIGVDVVVRIHEGYSARDAFGNLVPVIGTRVFTVPIEVGLRTVLPEPSTVILMATGVLLLSATAYLRKRVQD